jgi:hypothetical protein
MTDARPFTVVCVADDSRSTERADFVENTFVAFVMAENVSEAMAAGQVQAAESGFRTERANRLGGGLYGRRASSQRKR